MVRSSNEISRETCQNQSVDGNSNAVMESLPKKSRPVTLIVVTGSETNNQRGMSVEASGRSQSPHSSEEAVQHNAVEPRGAGR